MSDASAPRAHGATCRWKIRAVMSALYVDVWPQPTSPSVVVSRTKQTYSSWNVSRDWIRPSSPASFTFTVTSRSPIEDKHTASTPTCAQIVEGFLKLVQRDPARDQLVQDEIAAQIVAYQDRDVAVQIRRSEIASLHGLLADERACIEGEPGTAGQQPDKHELPAYIQAGPRLLHRLLVAQCLERVIRPADEGAHRSNRIVGAGVDRVGRAESPRQLELAVADVNGDDSPSASKPRALDNIQPDAATAVNHDARTGRDPGGVVHGAVSGQDGAAQQRRVVQGHSLGEHDGPGFRDHRVLRQGRHREKVMERSAVVAEPTRPVKQRARRHRSPSYRAVVRAADGAGPAGAARGDDREYDGIALS